jgi:argininosuccinate lyase
VTYGRVNESPLGAGPIGGTSIPINRKSTAKMLGFHGIIENSIDATGTRDFVAEFVSVVAILMTNLSRVSEDFAIWSTSEFGFIELSDEFSSPSSVMPQKKNPDMLELTRGKTAQVIGNVTTVLAALKGLSSGYNRDLQQIKSTIWTTSKIGISALIVIKLMLLTVSVNKTKMKKATESGYLIALDLAEKLVQKSIPFRTAHQVIGKLVQLANYSKKPISKITPNELNTAIKGTTVNSKFLSEIIKSTTINSSLRDRISQGSSGIAEQKRMIDNRMKKINAYREGITKRDKDVKNALYNLSLKVKELTK